LKLFFNGSKCIHREREGIILINPHDDVIPIFYHLSFDYTKNITKYEALILGMTDAILLKVKRIKIFGDSQLIMKQVTSIYNTNDAKLQPYKEMVTILLMYFVEYEIESIPRDSNRYIDDMDIIVSLSPMNIEDKESILTTKKISGPSHEYVVEDHCSSATCIYVCEWYQDIFYFIILKWSNYYCILS